MPVVLLIAPDGALRDALQDTLELFWQSILVVGDEEICSEKPSRQPDLIIFDSRSGSGLPEVRGQRQYTASAIFPVPLITLTSDLGAGRSGAALRLAHGCRLNKPFSMGQFVATVAPFLGAPNGHAYLPPAA